MGTLKTLITIGLLSWFAQLCVRFGYQLNQNSNPLLKQFVLEQLLGEQPAEKPDPSPIETIKRFFK
jgi:hypothetical protein